MLYYTKHDVTFAFDSSMHYESKIRCRFCIRRATGLVLDSEWISKLYNYSDSR